MTTYGASPSGQASIVTALLSAFDCGNIVANTIVDTTVALAPALTTDMVVITPKADLESGLMIQARVSAAGVLKIRVANVTTAAINPAAVDLNVALIRF